MSYRLIALDLDGTLLNSRKEVPPESAEAVRAVCAGKRKPSACVPFPGNSSAGSWMSPGPRTSCPSSCFRGRT